MSDPPPVVSKYPYMSTNLNHDRYLRVHDGLQVATAHPGTQTYLSDLFSGRLSSHAAGLNLQFPPAPKRLQPSPRIERSRHVAPPLRWYVKMIIKVTSSVFVCWLGGCSNLLHDCPRQRRPFYDDRTNSPSDPA